MKKISLIIVIALSILVFKCNAQQTAITSENGLVDYLKNNWQTPEEYVIKKFENHDYVFILSLIVAIFGVILNILIFIVLPGK